MRVFPVTDGKTRPIDGHRRFPGPLAVSSPPAYLRTSRRGTNVHPGLASQPAGYARCVKGLRRRSSDDVPLVADLHGRIAMYSRAAQIRCKGCGRWVVEDEAQAERWGYYRVYPDDKLYPYCAECAAREFDLHLV